MLQKSTILPYPFLLLLSIGKKSFENMGRLVNMSGRIIAKALQPAHDSFEASYKICSSVFSSKNKLFLIIDDTLIKKIFASNMRGTCLFYDTKIGRMVNAYKLITAMLSDGNLSIPMSCAFLFSREIVNLCSERHLSKAEIVKSFIRTIIKLFPGIKIVLVADGLYSSIGLLGWCVENKICAEMRMHSNRIVTYKGMRIKLRELANLPGVKLVGKQTARTISVEWHDLPLEITIVKRVNKHGEESIVYQVATYKAEPREHVKAYKVRWNTEKAYRTEKQSLGLGDCYSKDLDVQLNHVSATLLAYAIAQCEMKRQQVKTTEAAIRGIKEKFNQHGIDQLIDQFDFNLGLSA